MTETKVSKRSAPSDEKITCECGSVVQAKNLSAHKKSKKHLSAVCVVVPGSDKPENLSEQLAKKGVKKVMIKEPEREEDLQEEHLEGDDGLDDIDVILDAIQAIHDRLDELQHIMTVGFQELIDGLDEEPVAEKDKVVAVPKSE